MCACMLKKYVHVYEWFVSCTVHVMCMGTHEMLFRHSAHTRCRCVCVVHNGV